MKKDNRATTIVLPIQLLAWLAYQAVMEKTSMTAIIIRALRAEYAKAAKKDPNCPPI